MTKYSTQAWTLSKGGVQAPLSKISTQEVEQPYVSTGDMKKLAEELWVSKLSLVEQKYNGEAEIKHDEKTGYPAIFVGDKRKEYSGPQYKLAGATSEGINICFMRYHEVAALQNEEYKRLFSESNKEFKDFLAPAGELYGSVAPVAYLMTEDNDILLTERGLRVGKYPGANWGIGGDISDPCETIKGKAESEISEETLIKEYSLHVFLGFTADNVLKKYDAAILGKAKGKIFGTTGEEDAVSLRLISAKEDDLGSLILESYVYDTPDSDVWKGRPSAAGNGGLFLVFKELYGTEAAQSLHKEILRRE